jgi:hypothetical protein
MDRPDAGSSSNLQHSPSSTSLVMQVGTSRAEEYGAEGTGHLFFAADPRRNSLKLIHFVLKFVRWVSFIAFDPIRGAGPPPLPSPSDAAPCDPRDWMERVEGCK